MKTLTIRRWLFLAWLSTVVIGNVLFGIAEYINHRNDERQLQALYAISNDVMTDAAHWSDPSWQNSLRARLTTWGDVIEIKDGAGREEFKSAPLPENAQPTERIILLNGGRTVGTVNLFAPGIDQFWVRTRIVLVLFLLLLPSVVVGLFLGKMVLRPLAAMSQAARQIARGELTFSLPTSRVQEVAEVSTAFHVMGDALRAALERQAQVEQERRLFISAIAHDLRTPLFSLRGYLEGLATGIAVDPEKRAHYLAVCQEQAALLEQRIAALFAYARLEYLGQAPQLATVDLPLLMQQLLARFRPLLVNKEITVQVTGIDHVGKLQGDGQMLTRVFENLLDNAVRYTPHGGPITLDWRQEPERICFTVADTGPGIAPEDLPHIFAPLYQSDAARQPKAHGAGLGLTIARQILQAHGGGLIARNGATGGAEFTGWLPVASNGKMETLVQQAAKA